MPQQEVPELGGLIREAIDVLSEGFAIFDSDQQLIFANRISRRDFGRTYAAMARGATWLEALRESVRPHMPGIPEEELRAFARPSAEIPVSDPGCRRTADARRARRRPGRRRDDARAAAH